MGLLDVVSLQDVRQRRSLPVRANRQRTGVVIAASLLDEERAVGVQRDTSKVAGVWSEVRYSEDVTRPHPAERPLDTAAVPDPVDGQVLGTLLDVPAQGQLGVPALVGGFSRGLAYVGYVPLPP